MLKWWSGRNILGGVQTEASASPHTSFHKKEFGSKLLKAHGPRCFRVCQTFGVGSESTQVTSTSVRICPKRALIKNDFARLYGMWRYVSRHRFIDNGSIFLFSSRNGPWKNLSSLGCAWTLTGLGIPGVWSWVVPGVWRRSFYRLA